MFTLVFALIMQGFADCRTVPYECSPNTTEDVIYALLIASLFVYFLGTGFLLRRSFVYLRTKPYNQMRMANQHLRINVSNLTQNCSPPKPWPCIFFCVIGLAIQPSYIRGLRCTSPTLHKGSHPVNSPHVGRILPSPDLSPLPKLSRRRLSHRSDVTC